MTTEAAIISRVRLEIGDELTSFQSAVVGDGETRSFELPHSPILASGFAAFTVDTSTTPAATTLLVDGGDFTLDVTAGTITLASALPDGMQLVTSGSAAKYFSDTDMATFVRTAVIQHLHGRQGVTLERLPPVEEYPLALLAAIEALYALMNDAAFDIDVSTPEGVGIPRSQRFRQLQEMIEARKEQYRELCMALNIGLNRIEVSTLRRVSRTTGKFVPLYLPQELEDHSAPRRVHVPVDLQGAKVINDPVQIHDITVEQGLPLILDVDAEMDLTGKTVKAQLRRGEMAGPLMYFTVTVVDAAAGLLTLELRDTSRYRLWFDGDLYWDLKVIDPIGGDYPHVEQTLLKGKVYVVERPRI